MQPITFTAETMETKSYFDYLQSLKAGDEVAVGWMGFREPHPIWLQVTFIASKSMKLEAEGKKGGSFCRTTGRERGDPNSLFAILPPSEETMQRAREIRDRESCYRRICEAHRDYMLSEWDIDRVREVLEVLRP